VPGIAGRFASYLVRQLWDFKQGDRKGEWAPLMQQVVAKLSVDDMIESHRLRLVAAGRASSAWRRSPVS
jgi:cytochrome c553